MALYSRAQTFAAGNSSTSMDQSGWNPAGNLPGGDPLYPFLVYADEVHVATSPNRLTKWAGGQWRFMQWWEADFGPEPETPNAWFPGQRFVYEVTYLIKAAALADSNYFPSFLQSADSTGPVYDNAVGLSLYLTSTPGWFGIELFYRSWADDIEFIQTYTLDGDDISEKTVVFRVQGCCGTPTLAGDGITNVAADGYITATMTIDGGAPITVYDFTGIDLYVSYSQNNRLRGYQMGSGIPGEITRILIEGDTTCASGGSPGGSPPEPTPLPDDVGKICKCKTGDGDGTGTPPSVLPVLQPWSPECTGGGLVPLAAAPSAAELW